MHFAHVALLAVLAAFNWGVEQGHFSVNPIKKLRRRDTGRRERVLTLAQSDIFHRHDELIDDPHQHAAFRRRVELRDDDAREQRRLVEELRLRERVLARGTAAP